MINEDLADEFFLQLFRQMNRKSKSEKSAKALSITLYIMVALSKHLVPSKDLLEYYEGWLNSFKDEE